MLRQLLTLAAATTVAAAPMRLYAQSAPTKPTPGQRVRLHLVPPTGSVDGIVLGWAVDTLVLGPLRRSRSMPDTLMRVPRTSIVSFQPSIGPDRGRGFVRGAKTGALVGGMIGLAVLLLGVLSDAGAPCHDCFVSASVIGGVFAVATTAGGTLIGAALGAAGAPDRWGSAELVGSAEHYRRSRQLALRLSVAR